MRHYSIAFVGLGSIGKRHFKNVCELIESQGDSYDIDLYRSDLSRELPSDILPKVAKQFLYADEISSDKLYDAVFVTNPTSMHYEAVRKFAKHAKSFSLKNLSLTRLRLMSHCSMPSITSLRMWLVHFDIIQYCNM